MWNLLTDQLWGGPRLHSSAQPSAPSLKFIICTCRQMSLRKRSVTAQPNPKVATVCLLLGRGANRIFGRTYIHLILKFRKELNP